MLKRILAGGLTAALTLSLATLPASALAVEDQVMETIRALDIMVGDEKGNLNLESNITRAEFTKMLLTASVYKDQIGTSGYSSFADVKSNHWASGYIKKAVDVGYLNGYIDGSFRPDTNIPLEQACTAILNLLGYDTNNLGGSYPTAQVNKAEELGLLNDIDAEIGELLTRETCAQLFYNLLEVPTQTGYYGTTIGCPVTNGEVDYLQLVQTSLEGAYVYKEGDALSFDPISYYKDGVASDPITLKAGDVYYYNENTRTLWVYRETVTGTIQALSPSSISPTAVTIDGTTYPILTTSAAYQLSSLNGTQVDDCVTLLLGMDDGVAGVLGDDTVAGLYYGIVESAVVSLNDDSQMETSLTITGTNGVTYRFTELGDKEWEAEDMVSVAVTTKGTTVTALSTKSITGSFNKAATTFGDYTLADDVEILDVNNGIGISIDPERLAGITLKKGDVRYYVLDSDGNLAHLILNAVTGDTLDYGYMINATVMGSGMNKMASYTYYLNGMPKNISSAAIYAVDVGGMAVAYENDGSFDYIRNLVDSTVTQLTDTKVLANQREYQLADEVAIYLKYNDAYQLVELDQVDDLDSYKLTAWVDNLGFTAGGLVRVIIATAK